ncbi:MAG TPA: MgtC/SapB family protein [Longimicrobiaceae bacterium]|nr:MgtC/SapB family protein [Longimicrobiaceae bacterium]
MTTAAILAQVAWPEAASLLDHLALLGRLLLAAVLGGVIGLERELSGKPAGLRTNLLICVGAALLMELSIGVAALANLPNEQAGAVFRADPARIAAQIVSGIGFLGAGTILQARGNIIGLTTAATIWVVAAIGMAVGAQAYVEAIGATILVYLSLSGLNRVEIALSRRRSFRRYIVAVDPDPELLAEIEASFRTGGLNVETASLEKGDRYEAAFDVNGPVRRHEEVVRDLAFRSGVHRVTRSL